MSGHTPEPWLFTEDGSVYATETTPERFERNRMWLHVEVFSNGAMGRSTAEEALANARLIAAAPRMYAFIEHVSRLRVGDAPPYQEAIEILEEIEEGR